MFLFWILFGLTSSHAFSPINHEQITRSAIRYVLERSGDATGFARWVRPLSPENREWLSQILIRGTVDPDFNPDLWGTVLGYGPVTAIENSNGRVLFFTSLYHFLNVRQPGQYWDYDGYAYRNSWGRDYDQLFSLPFSSIRGDLSSGLGASTYHRGFRGTEKDWQHLFFDSGNSKRAVYPPAYVPAELAYETFLSSLPAKASSEQHRLRDIPAISGVLKGLTLRRWYWHGELQGLPTGLYDFGTALHMTQDMCVPQHTQGTLDCCHHELEAEADILSCRRVPGIGEYLKYQDGNYSGRLECQAMYDPKLVADLVRRAPPFDLKRKISIKDRMVELARITAHWTWGDPVETVALIGTELPDGKVFTADRCSELVVVPEIHEQIRLQYNLAVAATVTLLDLAADEYKPK